jgi:hypothetical protein
MNKCTTFDLQILINITNTNTPIKTQSITIIALLHVSVQQCNPHGFRQNKEYNSKCYIIYLCYLPQSKDSCIKPSKYIKFIKYKIMN